METFKIEIPQGYEVDTIKSTFENIVFREVKKEITERVKTVEDAIQELGEKDEEVVQLRKLQSVFGLSEVILNNQIAVVIVKALNESWKPNWNDSNQPKYYPWFYLGDNFRYYCYGDWWTGSVASSRLCLKNSNLAEYAGKQFAQVYKKFMN